ncbi:MAG: acyltransferase family protein [Janthinobacterium lividum]
MSYFSIWPMLAMVLVVIAVVSWPSPFGFLDATPTGSAHRLESLDGLRGLLAISVMFHHFVIKRWSIASGRWELPPSHFYALLGQVGVAIFFMITGYLFWGKIQDQKGQTNWARLYINRFFRIAPLHILVLLIYLLAVLYRARFHVGIPLSEMTMQWLRWILYPGTPVLGDLMATNIVSQTWTLSYEWLFYLSLPVLAIFATSRSALAICVTALLVILLFGNSGTDLNRYFLAQFLCGAVVASLVRSYPKLQGDGPVRSLIAIAVLFLGFRVCDTAYATKAVLFFGIFFGFIASGTSLFGLLKISGTRRLGHASYSLYLLHGLVLTIVMAPSTLGPYSNSSARHFWEVAALGFLCVVCLSMISFRIVERGGIRLGKLFMARLAPARPN